MEVARELGGGADGIADEGVFPVNRPCLSRISDFFLLIRRGNVGGQR